MKFLNKLIDEAVEKKIKKLLEEKNFKKLIEKKIDTLVVDHLVKNIDIDSIVDRQIKDTIKDEICAYGVVTQIEREIREKVDATIDEDDVMSELMEDIKRTLKENL